MPTWHSILCTFIIAEIVVYVHVRVSFGVQGKGTFYSKALTGT
jgi:hypothetical protein